MAPKKPRKPRATRAAAPCQGARPFSITIKGEAPSSLRAGWFSVLDRALATGDEALKDCRYPLWRAYLEHRIAIVRKARAGDPLMAMLKPTILHACLDLERFGQAPRMEVDAIRLSKTSAAKARTSITARHAAKLKTICDGNGWSIDNLDTRKKEKLAAEMKRSPRAIERYIDALKK
jgi:hypothetical protein